MPRKAEPPPPAQRRHKKGSIVRTPEVCLTASASAAADFLSAKLAEEPREEYPARLSGAVCLALEEAAAARGWVKPSKAKAQA